MSIQKYENTELQTLTPQERGSALIRETAAVMADALALANAVASTSMVPKHFKDKPEETAAAMLYGASLGLDPMQAVKSVYVVHGQAALYARSMDALVKSAGHETWTVESTDEQVTVAGRRAGTERVEQSTWTIARATRAGYTSNEKYKTDPQAMLHAKAMAEVCRKIAPDVLMGVYSVEERQMEYVEAEVVERRPTRSLGAAMDSAPAPAPDAAPAAGESPLLNPRSALAKRMFAALNESGITAKDDRLDYCSGQVGREIKTSGELTDAEAEAIITSLQELQEPAPEQAPEAEQ